MQQMIRRLTSRLNGSSQAPAFAARFEALEDRRLLSVASAVCPWSVSQAANAAAADIAAHIGVKPNLGHAGSNSGKPTTSSGTSTSVSGSHGKATGVTIDAQTGTAFSGEVGSLKDLKVADGITLHCIINWGDGTSTSDGTIAADADGVYHVTGSHTYLAPGTFKISVITTGSATPSSGGGATPLFVELFPAIHSKAVVTGAATPGAGGVTLTLTTGTEFNGSVGSFTGPTPDTVSKYFATINWGDGKTSRGTLQSGQNGYDIIGTHTYKKAGTYSIVTHAGAAPTASTNAIVPTHTITVIQSVANVTGNPTSGGDGSGADGSASISDGTLVITGTSGDDTIKVSQYSIMAILDPLPKGVASLVSTVVPPTETFFDISINGHLHTLSADNVTKVSVDAGDGNDSVSLAGNPDLAYPLTIPVSSIASVLGGRGDAVTFDAVIHGGKGNDILTGGSGSDELFGDDDNDTLNAGPGNDKAHGGAGDDTAVNVAAKNSTPAYSFTSIDSDVEHVVTK